MQHKLSTTNINIRAAALKRLGHEIDGLSDDAILALWGETLAELYSAHPMNSIAQMTGISTPTVSSDLTRMGVETRSRMDPRRFDPPVVWAGKEYNTTGELARALRVPHSTIYRKFRAGTLMTWLRLEQTQEERGNMVCRKAIGSGLAVSSVATMQAVCKARYTPHGQYRLACTGCEYGRLAKAGKIDALPSNVSFLG